MTVIASVSFLNQLYKSLCSSSVPGYTSTSVQTYCMQFLNDLSDSTNYATMVGAIDAWVASTTIPQAAVGLPSSTVIPGLRVFVIDPNGTTAYDSLAGVNNVYANINKPRADFLTSGRYMINENLGARSYIMGAALSQTGVFSQAKYSNTANKKLLYLAIRQGLSSAEPLGFIVVSMDA
jgi:hypothetical protein